MQTGRRADYEPHGQKDTIYIPYSGGLHMEISELSVGMEVSVCAVIEEQTLTFPSKIAAISAPNILIDPIANNGKAVGFNPDIPVSLLVNANEKIFRWEVSSIKLVKSRGKIYHMAELSGIGTPYNRRKNFRLFIGEQMHITIFGASGAESAVALLKDISEGGFCIITNKDIDPKFHIRLHFEDRLFAVDLPATIVRKIPTSRPGEFLYGCSLRIKSDTLSKYIMRRQMAEIKRKNS